MKKLSILLAVAAILAAAGASFAAIPSSNGVISACKDNKGVLKVIDAEAGQTCNGNQQPLTWNQQGPAGPPGPGGINGYERVHVNVPIAPYGAASGEAVCSDGKRPVSGGFALGTLHVRVIASVPYDLPAAEPGWYVAASNEGPSPIEITVWALCASVS